MKGIRGIMFGKNRRIDYVENLENHFDFRPSRNEVLVKMLYCPVNPSDFYSIYRIYHDKKDPPFISGFEGFGEVIETGEGVDSSLIGKRVNSMFFSSSYGSYTSHSIANIKDILLVDEASQDWNKNRFLVNTVTSIGLKELIDKTKTSSFLQTGASTMVGRTLLHLTGKKYSSINIVRSAKHVESLKALGASKVLVSTDPKFEANLKELIKQYNPSIGFDCVGAELTGFVFNTMPRDSCLFVYGALGLKPCSGIDPQQLIFTNKQIKGFHLYHSLLNRMPLQSYTGPVNAIYSSYKDDSETIKRYDLKDYKTMLSDYRDKSERFLFSIS